MNTLLKKTEDPKSKRKINTVRNNLVAKNLTRQKISADASSQTETRDSGGQANP